MSSRRLPATLALLALLLPACFLRSTLGVVYVDSITGDLQRTSAALDAGATVAICITGSELTSLNGTCTYVFSNGTVTSTFRLQSEYGVFGLIVDPLVVQVPDDASEVVVTVSREGVADQAADVSLVDSVLAATGVRITPEPGHRFLIIDLPQQERFEHEVGIAGERDYDFSLQMTLDEPRSIDLRVVFTAYIRTDFGQDIYVPLLPCVASPTSWPRLTLPLGEGPEDLQPLDAQIEALVPGASGCQDRDFDLRQGNGGEITRYAGADRIATALAVSRASFAADGSAGAVVLARADAFPDALAGTPLAVQENAPILLSNPDTLDVRSAAEIGRVLPAGGTVFLLGGEAALTAAVADAVSALGYTVQRLAGASRVETAAAVAARLDGVETLFLADGGEFGPGLIGAAAAGLRDGALLLTAGGTLPAATQAVIDANVAAPRTAIGDPAVAADPDATAVAGSDPVGLSVALSAQLFPDEPAFVGVASGLAFPDGLTGGPLVARNGGALLLSHTDAAPADLVSYLEGVSPVAQSGAIFGGPAAISEPQHFDLRRAIAGLDRAG